MSNFLFPVILDIVPLRTELSRQRNWEKPCDVLLQLGTANWTCNKMNHFQACRSLTAC